MTCLGPQGRCAAPDPIPSLRHLLCFPGPGPYCANGAHLGLRAPEVDCPGNTGLWVRAVCAQGRPAPRPRAPGPWGVRGDQRAASLPVFGIFQEYCQGLHRPSVRVRGCAEWVLDPERDL